MAIFGKKKSDKDKASGNNGPTSADSVSSLSPSLEGTASKVTGSQVLREGSKIPGPAGGSHMGNKGSISGPGSAGVGSGFGTPGGPAAQPSQIPGPPGAASGFKFGGTPPPRPDHPSMVNGSGIPAPSGAMRQRQVSNDSSSSHRGYNPALGMTAGPGSGPGHGPNGSGFGAGAGLPGALGGAPSPSTSAAAPPIGGGPLSGLPPSSSGPGIPLSSSGNPAAMGPGAAPGMGGGGALNAGPVSGDKIRSQQVVYPWSQRGIVMNPPRFLDESRQAPPGALSPFPFPRYGHAANQIASPNGEVYLFGGLVRESVKNDLYTVYVDRLVTNPQDPSSPPPANGSAAANNQQLYASATLVQTTGEIPPPRVGHATVLVSNVLILWGGDTKVRADDKQDEGLYLLNLSTREWTRVKAASDAPDSAPVGRYGHTVWIIGSKFYVFGGQVDGAFLNDFWSFDLNSLKGTPTWERITPASDLPPKRTGHVSVTYKDKVYIFGGTDGQYHYNDTWCYDVATNAWKELSCIGYIPVPREGHATCLVDDVMYIFGGRGVDGKDLGDLVSFKISNQRWYMFANMGPSPTGRSGHALAAYQNKVVVLGGESFNVGVKPDDPSLIHVLDTAKIKYPPDNPASQRPGAAANGNGRKSSLSGGITAPGPQPQPQMLQQQQQQQQQQSAFGSTRSATSPVAEEDLRSRATSPTQRGKQQYGNPPSPQSQGQQSASGMRNINGVLDRTDSPSNAAGATVGAAAPQAGFHYGRNVTPPSMSASSANGQHAPPQAAARSVNAELEAMRKRETWLKAALAMAAKKGFVEPEQLQMPDGSTVEGRSETSDRMSLDGFDTGAEGSDKDRIFKVLVSLKAQLAGAKATIAQQAQAEDDRMAETDRARSAALQEAAYYRVKLAALEAGSASDVSRVDKERAAKLEKSFADALREGAQLERQLSSLREQAKLEQQLRISAEERLSETAKRAMAAEAAQMKAYDELSALQKRSYASESSLRDYAEQVATLSSAAARHRADYEHARSQLDTHKSSVDAHVRALTELQAAHAAVQARAAEHERRHSEQRDLAQQHATTIAELQARLEARSQEAYQHSSRSAELETLLAQHRQEAETHRAAVSGGLATLLAAASQRDQLGNTARDLGGANNGVGADGVPPHVEAKMRALKEEAEALRALHGQAKDAADSYSTALQETRESSLAVEKQHAGLRTELSAMRSQLTVALQEAARLKHGSSSGGVGKDPFELRSASRAGDGSNGHGSSSTAAALVEAQQRATRAEDELAETTASYKERMAQLENDYQTAVQFVKGTEKMLRRMKDELTKTKTENAQLQSEVAALRSGQLNAASDDGGAASEEAARDIEALRHRLADVTQQSEEVAAENRELERRLAELSADHQRTVSERARDAELAHGRTGSEQLRRENAALSAKCAELEDKFQLLLGKMETTHGDDEAHRDSMIYGSIASELDKWERDRTLGTTVEHVAPSDDHDERTTVTARS